MVILPLVEGHGDAAAVPELIRRICQDLGNYDVHVRTGYRAPKSELSNPGKLQVIIEAAYRQYSPDAIVVLFDADDDCPKELARALGPVCESAPIRSALVVANREYEAWFLGATESLRDQASIREDAESHSDPETPRDAKGHLEHRMTEPYAETLHQKKFSASLDLGLCSQNCRSFRRLRNAILTLLELE